MSIHANRWISPGVLTGLISSLCGCAPQGAPSTQQSSLVSELTTAIIGGDDSAQIQDPLCPQTVSTAPSNVFLSMSVSGTGSIVSGASSGLAQALRYMWQVEEVVDYFWVLYEVGENGTVLATIHLPLPLWVRQGAFYEDPHCGLGRISLWQNGTIGFHGEGGQACLDFDILGQCRRCWQDGEGWHQHFSYRMSYMALGSLDGVAVMAENGEDSGQRVMVSTGETVVAEMTFEMHYLLSPSPEELGFQLMELPTWP
jgi:hypothetical protein